MPIKWLPKCKVWHGLCSIRSITIKHRVMSTIAIILIIYVALDIVVDAIVLTILLRNGWRLRSLAWYLRDLLRYSRQAFVTGVVRRNYYLIDEDDYEDEDY